MDFPVDSERVREVRDRAIAAWRQYREVLAAELATADQVLAVLRREEHPRGRRPGYGGAGDYLRKWIVRHPGETISISEALEWVLAAGWDASSVITPRGVVGSALAQLVTGGELYREARGVYRAPGGAG